MKDLTTILLILAMSAIASAQDFNVKMGVSYQPVVLTDNTLLQDYSLMPAVDIYLSGGNAALKISLGSVTRLGFVVVNSFGLIIGFNYAYHLSPVKTQKHSVEIELGAAIRVGENKDYILSISTKAGILTDTNRMYLVPVSIGISKRIE